MIRWKYAQQGCFELVWEGKTVLCGHAQAQHADGRKIDKEEPPKTEDTNKYSIDAEKTELFK